MTISVLGLLVLSGLLHAGWNYLLKNADNKYIIIWWALVLGSLLGLPILILNWPIPTIIWPFAVAIALIETIYDAILAAAYNKEDFSLVYPIARGGAPALLGLWAILFLNEIPSPAGMVGLLIITAGLMIVGSSKWWSERKKGVGSIAGIGLACLVAIMISFYSVIDGAAVSFMDAASYTVLVFILNSIFVIPIITKLYSWQTVVDVGRKKWRQLILIGFMDIGSYMLVLIAFSLASVAYAGAVREIRIVF